MCVCVCFLTIRKMGPFKFIPFDRSIIYVQCNAYNGVMSLPETFCIFHGWHLHCEAAKMWMREAKNDIVSILFSIMMRVCFLPIVNEYFLPIKCSMVYNNQTIWRDQWEKNRHCCSRRIQIFAHSTAAFISLAAIGHFFVALVWNELMILLTGLACPSCSMMDSLKYMVHRHTASYSHYPSTANPAIALI